MRPALNDNLRRIGLALIEQEEQRAREALELSGPSPSPFGFMLERAERESVDSLGRPHPPNAQAIPCRDDGHLWSRCGRDFAPDYSQRFEALLTERQKRILMLGAQVSASDAAAELGLTLRQYQRRVRVIRSTLRRVRR